MKKREKNKIEEGKLESGIKMETEENKGRKKRRRRQGKGEIRLRREG